MNQVVQDTEPGSGCLTRQLSVTGGAADQDDDQSGAHVSVEVSFVKRRKVEKATTAAAALWPHSFALESDFRSSLALCS